MAEIELLLANRDFVRALARELLSESADVDDVVQQTMLAAWINVTGSGKGRFRSWLATVARNFARQAHRRNERRKEREQRAAACERVLSVTEVLEREERRRSVVQAVLGLAEPYRTAVLLRFYEGLAPREIARRLDVPAETARTRVKRGLEQVRERIVEGNAARRKDLRAWLLPIALPVPSGPPLVALAGAIAATGLVAFVTWSFASGPWSLHDDEGRVTAPAAPASASPESAALSTARTTKTSDAATRASEPEAAHAEPPPSPLLATLPISGRVVDAGNAPISGARVLAWPDELDSSIRLDDEQALAKRPQATTDDTGRFELAVPADLEFCTLFAMHELHSPGTVLSIVPGARDVQLLLEGRDSVTGFVTDERGVPIEGARVRSWGLHGGALIEHETKSASDGGYRLLAPITDRAAWSGDSDSWRWWIEATAGGFAPRVIARDRNLDPDVQPGEHRIDIELERGVDVSGLVIDAETRDPIPDARVVMVAFEEWISMRRHVGGQIMNPYGERVVASAVTDEKGEYLLANTPQCRERTALMDKIGAPDNLNLYAIAEGYAPSLGFVPATNDGASVQVTFEMWHSAIVVGRVVDRERRPIAGVRVGASVLNRSLFLPRECVGPGFSPQIRTDEDGRYEVRGIPVPAREEVLVRMSTDAGESRWDSSELTEEVLNGRVHRYWRTTFTESMASAGQVRIAPDLVVHPLPSAVVEVVDEREAPIARARVTTKWDSGGQLTDRSGRVRWFEQDATYVQADRSIEKRQSARFRIKHPGFVPATTAELTLSVDDPPVARIVLARGHELHGTLVGLADRPAARASVTALSRVPTEEELASILENKPIQGADLILSGAVTDAAGRFAFDDLPPGRVVLVAYPPLGWRGTRPERPTVIPDVLVDGPPFTARLADR